MAEERVMHFEFPLPVGLGNSRMHWRMKHRKKLAYWELLDALVMARKLPKAPESPMIKPEAQISMRTWRRCDTDNAHSRLKWTFDFLETRGYIVNDRDLVYHLEHRTAPRAELGISMTLREAA